MQHLFVQPSWNTDLIPSNSPQSTAVTAVCVHARGHASACLPACLSVCLSVLVDMGFGKEKRFTLVNQNAAGFPPKSLFCRLRDCARMGTAGLVRATKL